MFIAVASAAGKQARKRDVNEIVLDSGAGWTKGADGYSYDVPETPLKAEPVAEVIPEEPQPEVYEEVVVAAGKFNARISIANFYKYSNFTEPIPEEPVVEEIVAVAEDVPAPTVDNEYLPPTNDYLPPARRRLRFRRRYRLVKRQ
jgi:hypothetical protein